MDNKKNTNLCFILTIECLAQKKGQGIFIFFIFITRLVLVIKICDNWYLYNNLSISEIILFEISCTIAGRLD
jgi:hypothetical protein